MSRGGYRENSGRKPLDKSEKKVWHTVSIMIENTDTNLNKINKAISLAQGNTKGEKLISIIDTFLSVQNSSN